MCHVRYSTLQKEKKKATEINKLYDSLLTMTRKGKNEDVYESIGLRAISSHCWVLSVFAFYIFWLLFERIWHSQNDTLTLRISTKFVIVRIYYYTAGSLKHGDSLDLFAILLRKC